MRVTCYDIMSNVKVVSLLRLGLGYGNASASQPRSGEEVRLFFGTEQNSWSGVGAPSTPSFLLKKSAQKDYGQTRLLTKKSSLLHVQLLLAPVALLYRLTLNLPNSTHTAYI